MKKIFVLLSILILSLSLFVFGCNSNTQSTQSQSIQNTIPLLDDDEFTLGGPQYQSISIGYIYDGAVIINHDKDPDYTNFTWESGEHRYELKVTKGQGLELFQDSYLKYTITDETMKQIWQ